MRSSIRETNVPKPTKCFFKSVIQESIKAMTSYSQFTGNGQGSSKPGSFVHGYAKKRRVRANTNRQFYEHDTRSNPEFYSYAPASRKSRISTMYSVQENKKKFTDPSMVFNENPEVEEEDVYSENVEELSTNSVAEPTMTNNNPVVHRSAVISAAAENCNGKFQFSFEQSRTLFQNTKLRKKLLKTQRKLRQQAIALRQQKQSCLSSCCCTCACISIKRGAFNQSKYISMAGGSGDGGGGGGGATGGGKQLLNISTFGKQLEHFHHHVYTSEIDNGSSTCNSIQCDKQRKRGYEQSKVRLQGLRSVVSVRETHQIAEAQQEKNAKLREAFGISEYFVEGSSFDPDRKAKEDLAKSTALQHELQAQKEAEKEKSKRYALVRTPSPERDDNDTGGVGKKNKKKKRRDGSNSPDPKKEKKRKSKKNKKERSKKKKSKKHRQKDDDTSADSDDSIDDDSTDSDEADESFKKRSKKSKKEKKKRSKRRKRSESKNSDASIQIERKRGKSPPSDKILEKSRPGRSRERGGSPPLDKMAKYRRSSPIIQKDKQRNRSISKTQSINKTSRRSRSRSQKRKAKSPIDQRSISPKRTKTNRSHSSDNEVKMANKSARSPRRKDQSNSRRRSNRSNSRRRNDRSNSRRRNDRSNSRRRNDRSNSHRRKDRSNSRQRNDRSNSRRRYDRSNSLHRNERSISRRRNDRSRSPRENKRRLPSPNRNKRTFSPPTKRNDKHRSPSPRKVARKRSVTPKRSIQKRSLSRKASTPKRDRRDRSMSNKQERKRSLTPKRYGRQRSRSDDNNRRDRKRSNSFSPKKKSPSRSPRRETYQKQSPTPSKSSHSEKSLPKSFRKRDKSPVTSGKKSLSPRDRGSSTLSYSKRESRSPYRSSKTNNENERKDRSNSKGRKLTSKTHSKNPFSLRKKSQSLSPTKDHSKSVQKPSNNERLLPSSSSQRNRSRSPLSPPRLSKHSRDSRSPIKAKDSHSKALKKEEPSTAEFSRSGHYSRREEFLKSPKRKSNTPPIKPSTNAAPKSKQPRKKSRSSGSDTSTLSYSPARRHPERYKDIILPQKDPQINKSPKTSKDRSRSPEPTAKMKTSKANSGHQKKKPQPVVRLHSSTGSESEDDHNNTNNDSPKVDKYGDVTITKKDDEIIRALSGIAAKAKEKIKTMSEPSTSTGLCAGGGAIHAGTISTNINNSKKSPEAFLSREMAIASVAYSTAGLEKTNESGRSTKHVEKPLKINEFKIKGRKELTEKITREIIKSRSHSKSGERGDSKDENSKKRRSRSRSRRSTSFSSSSGSSRSSSRSSDSRSATSRSSRSGSSSSNSSNRSRSSRSSRSPSIPRRRGSPSFLDRRRITSRER